MSDQREFYEQFYKRSDPYPTMHITDDEADVPAPEPQADRCDGCDWPLTPRVAAHPMQWCPCCSSRWKLGVQVHWGSHNDYGTYLCDGSREVSVGDEPSLAANKAFNEWAEEIDLRGDVTLAVLAFETGFNRGAAAIRAPLEAERDRLREARNSASDGLYFWSAKYAELEAAASDALEYVGNTGGDRHGEVVAVRARLRALLADHPTKDLEPQGG